MPVRCMIACIALSVDRGRPVLRPIPWRCEPRRAVGDTQQVSRSDDGLAMVTREEKDESRKTGCRLASLFTASVVDAALPLPVPEIGLSGCDPAAGASTARAAGREGALCRLSVRVEGSTPCLMLEVQKSPMARRFPLRNGWLRTRGANGAMGST